jgi:hypothetical protein
VTTPGWWWPSPAATEGEVLGPRREMHLQSDGTLSSERSGGIWIALLATLHAGIITYSGEIVLLGGVSGVGFPKTTGSLLRGYALLHTSGIALMQS